VTFGAQTAGHRFTRDWHPPTQHQVFWSSRTDTSRGWLDQSDPRVAQEHYRRTSSLAAAGILSEIVRGMQDAGEAN
jgi:hypothetical protein